MLDNLKMIFNMDKEHINGQMELFMKETFLKIHFKVMGYTQICKEINMQDSFKMAIKKEKVLLITKIMMFMKDNLKEIKKMVLGL